ncbi:MAG: hypothetical protein ACR2FO_00165 [Actinomycetota bacterium]
MNVIKKLEMEIQALSPTELAEFRARFREYDWKAWDRELEGDAAAGRLDEPANKALKEHEAGQTAPL